MSANNSALKGVLGNKYKTVGVVEDPKPAEDPSERRRVCAVALSDITIKSVFRLSLSYIFSMLRRLI